MFAHFRESVKDLLRTKQWSYAKLSRATKLSENTIKCFMCGATDSRRVAEKIADALDCNLNYYKGSYELSERS